MPNGISGDNSGFIIGGDPVSELALIELRALSNLLQQLLGTSSQAPDTLESIRNDQAFQLGVSLPLPGATL